MSGFQSELQKSRAKALRRDMTDAERLLWYHLRAHRFLGLSIRRQAPIGPWIVDFLIPSRGLILEVDGGQHAGNLRDARRDAELAGRGYRVFRVWNADIFENLDGVLTRLAEEVRA